MKQRLLFLLFFVAIITVIAIAAVRYLDRKDFDIYTQVSCDPSKEGLCFQRTCDQDNPCDDPYYKIIVITNSSIPACDPYSDQGCPEISCPVDSPSCKQYFCSDETEARFNTGDSCSVDNR